MRKRQRRRRRKKDNCKVSAFHANAKNTDRRKHDRLVKQHPFGFQWITIFAKNYFCNLDTG